MRGDILVILLAAVNSNAMADDYGLAVIQQIERRWLDENQLASVTSRSALIPQIGNLQATKRELESTQVGKCLSQTKIFFSKHMEFTIKSYFQFLDKDEVAAQMNTGIAKAFFGNYEQVKGICYENSLKKMDIMLLSEEHMKKVENQKPIE